MPMEGATGAAATAWGINELTSAVVFYCIALYSTTPEYGHLIQAPT